MKNLIASFISMSLLSCAAGDPLPGDKTHVDEPKQAQQKLEIARAQMDGRWIITSFDGKKPSALQEDSGGQRNPEFTFGPNGYGGTSGCNSLGGLGVLKGDRYYTAIGPQTVMGCFGTVLEQEKALHELFRSSPKVSLSGDDLMTLTGGGHKIMFEKKLGLVGEEQFDPLLLAGTRWLILSIDGQYQTARNQADRRPLSFDAKSWQARPICARLSGKWAQSGWNLNFGATTTNKQGCAQNETVQDTAIRELFASNPKFSSGPNGELLIAGGGHWMQLDNDRAETAKDMPSLSGSWDITSLDGRELVRFEHLDVGAPRMDFGATVYGGSTGCNNIIGNYIAREGRLYTGPGPTTQQGCANLAEQENRIYELLRNAPNIALSGDAIALVDRKGSMTLRRTSRAGTGFSKGKSLPSRYSGSFNYINGPSSKIYEGSKPSTIIVRGEILEIATSCGTITAVLKRRLDDLHMITKPESSGGSQCQGPPLLHHRLIYGLMNGPVGAIVDSNDELLLAGGGIWFSANSD